MSQETCAAASPFSALTYQEQQDRWLEWRSRQLDYRPAGHMETRAAEQTDKKGTADQAVPELPMLRIPNISMAAPAGHRELDQVLSRHAKALKNAGEFMRVTKT